MSLFRADSLHKKANLPKSMKFGELVKKSGCFDFGPSPISLLPPQSVKGNTILASLITKKNW